MLFLPNKFSCLELRAVMEVDELDRWGFVFLFCFGLFLFPMFPHLQLKKVGGSAPTVCTHHTWSSLPLPTLGLPARSLDLKQMGISLYRQSKTNVFT